MVSVLMALGIAVTAIVTLRAGLLAVRLWRGDANSYDQNRIRTGSITNAALGLVPTDYDGRRDYRVAAGIAFNRKANSWVEQGRLSAEAVQSTLRQ
jgi:hypothetical protein